MSSKIVVNAACLDFDGMELNNRDFITVHFRDSRTINNTEKFVAGGVSSQQSDNEIIH